MEADERAHRGIALERDFAEAYADSGYRTFWPLNRYRFVNGDEPLTEWLAFDEVLDALERLELPERVKSDLRSQITRPSDGA